MKRLMNLYLAVSMLVNLTILPAYARDSIRWGPVAEKRGEQLQIVTKALYKQGHVADAQALRSLEGLEGNGTDDQMMISLKIASKYLKYYGGPTLATPKPGDSLYVYPIFYGNWSRKDASSINGFFKSFSPAIPSTPDSRTVQNWWSLTTEKYKAAHGRTISSKIVLGKSVFDISSQAPFGVTKQLQDEHIRAIVRRGFNSWGGKPLRNAFYFVLTSPEIKVKDFGTSFCSYHSSFRSQKVNVAYAFVGNPYTQAPSTCTYQYYDGYAETKNGVAIDAAISWIAHSMTKMATNPYAVSGVRKGWSVADTGYENADLCVWDFGYVGFLVQPPSQFYMWNVRGTNNAYYLIQRNYNPKLKACVIMGGDKRDTPISLMVQ